MTVEIVSIILIFILSFILILKNFDLAFYILLILSVLLHKELFSFHRWDMLPVRAFMFAVLIAGLSRFFWFLLRGRINRDTVFKSLKDPFLISITMLWLVRGVSIINTKNLQASILLYGFFTSVVALIYFLYCRYSESEEKTLKYLKFYIFLVFGLTLFGYFQYFLHSKYSITIGALWSIPNNTPRIGSTFWDVNHYGSLIASLLPILCVLTLFVHSKLKKLLYVFAAISLTVSLLLTNSRTAWIIAFVAFVTFISLLFLKKFGRRGILYILIGFLLIAVPASIEYMDKSSPFRERIRHYFHYRLDSFDSHFLLLTGTFQVFQKFPVLGGGYGGFFEHFSSTEISATYFGRDPAGLNTRVPAHTIWGELLAETGILGLSIFLLFSANFIFTHIFLFFKVPTKKESLLSLTMASVYIGWMLAGLFYSYNSEFFWIVIVLFYLYGNAIRAKSYTYTEAYAYFLRSQKFFVLALTSLAVFLILLGIGSTHLIPWDEAIYAKISKNMVVSGDYMVLRWWPDKEWLEKPPLYMWFMSLSMRFLGFNSLAARLPSAIFGILTVLVTYLFGTKLRNRTTGYIAALSLLTNIHFLYYSRSSMLDITTTFFITLALYMYYISKESEGYNYWALSGLSVGLAVLTKGVVGLIPLLIVVLNEVYLYISKHQKLSYEMGLRYLTLVGISFMTFLPWHLVMIKEFGLYFIDTYLGYHVLNRATTGIEDKGRPLWWYFVVLKVSMRLWFVALIATIPYSIKKALRSKKFVFLLIYSFTILLFFSIPKSKVVWYIIPIYPVLGLMLGLFFESLFSTVIQKFYKSNIFIIKAVTLYIFTIVMLTYLFFVSHLVYVGDLTGSEARLLMLKDQEFGKDEFVYVDRIELPLVLFYTDGPFRVIDFLPTEETRVPSVRYDQDLILITKKGRYSSRVAGYDYDSKIIKEDGDWVLWQVESESRHDERIWEEEKKNAK